MHDGGICAISAVGLELTHLVHREVADVNYLSNYPRLAIQAFSFCQ